jgi:twitching motility protein PilT
MARLHELFRYVQGRNGSDLHLVAGLEPRIRRRGHLEAVEGWEVLSDAELKSILREVVSDEQWQEYLAGGDLDFAYGLEGVARFRGNYLKQEWGSSAVFRAIPQEIIPLEKLNLPPAIEKLAHLSRGLVLVTGPTGSGKSTTLAAIIDKINKTYRKHVVTIEDPVEFVHQNRECIFSQREVGTDCDGFSGALRGALREDADVILVGEMRDLETISLAITAAEMGTLVFGTLHTNGTANTIDRLIDAFPADQQAQVRITLSESLSAVVSQLLLPTADGKGRVGVNEILLKTGGLPNIIREGNTPMIRTLIQSGRSEGMQLMDDALQQMVDQKLITGHDAYLKATEKARFEHYLDE